MEESFEVGFGPHLTLDLYYCNRKKISDLKFIYNILHELPDFIGMKKISPPHVVFYEGSEGTFDKGGISGFVLITTSHITVHTFSEQEHVFIDIFSCKDFDVEKAERYLVEKFEAKKVDKNLFQRGLEFPKSIPVVRRFINKERKQLNRN
ncbi:MAG: adenosylmethionine decarboxylase [Nanoarchaeota archaeon]